MTFPLSVRDVMVRGIELQPFEAVAIAQQVIACAQIDASQESPQATPSLDTIRLGADGAVACGPSIIRRGPGEIGSLLAEMLPRNGSVRVPGALRFTIARALSEVEAPPFDSVAHLSAVLARHEHGDRIAVVRNLYIRATTSSTTHTATGANRRRHAPDAATLRRQLREADEELFRHLSRTVVPEASAQPARPRIAMIDPFVPRFESVASPGVDRQFNPADWVAGALVALLISFGAGYTAVANQRRTSVAKPAPSEPSSIGSSTIDASRRHLRDDDAVAPAADQRTTSAPRRRSPTKSP